MATGTEKVERIATTCAAIHKTRYLFNGLQQKTRKGLAAVTVLCYLCSI